MKIRTVNDGKYCSQVNTADVARGTSDLNFYLDLVTENYWTVTMEIKKLPFKIYCGMNNIILWTV